MVPELTPHERHGRERRSRRRADDGRRASGDGGGPSRDGRRAGGSTASIARSVRALVLVAAVALGAVALVAAGGAADETVGSTVDATDATGGDATPSATAGDATAIATGDGAGNATDGAGTFEWSASVDGAANTPPTIARGTAYVGSFDGTVYAFDAETGEERWTFEANDSVYSAPTVVGSADESPADGSPTSSPAT